MRALRTREVVAAAIGATIGWILFRTDVAGWACGFLLSLVVISAFTEAPSK